METARPITFFKRYSADMALCFVVFLAALAVRLPFNSYPHEVVLDEGFFATFMQHTLDGSRFFEGHPPLGWLAPSLLVKSSEVSAWPSSISGPGASFDGFPYARERTFEALLGSLIPVIAYLILRISGWRRTYSLIPSFLLTFDNALVLYSRVMLPETLILFFGLLALVFYFASERYESLGRTALASLAGITLGLCIGVKWTGIGFLAAILMTLFISKAYRRAVLVGALAFLAYAGVFVAYSFHFSPGPTDPALTVSHTTESLDVSALKFPHVLSVVDQARFFAEYNRDIYIYHRDYDKDFGAFVDAPADGFDALHPGAPYLWPLSLDPFPAWTSKDGIKHIEIIGNRFVWGLGLVAAAYVLLALAYELARKRRLDLAVESRVKLALALGYFFSYAPYFFVRRPLYLYTYFPALVFSLMLVPYLLADIKKKVRPRLYSVLIAAFIIAVLACFVWTAPLTYGI